MAQKKFNPIVAQPVKLTDKKPAQVKVDDKPAAFVFDKGNYRLFFVAMAVVAIGFVLMSGTTDIYDFRKIVLAPVVVLSGFVIGFLAIFRKPETKKA